MGEWTIREVSTGSLKFHADPEFEDVSWYVTKNPFYEIEETCVGNIKSNAQSKETTYQEESKPV